MPPTVIIPAAGTERRWNSYLGLPKHLIEVSGEVLLAYDLMELDIK